MHRSANHLARQNLVIHIKYLPKISLSLSLGQHFFHSAGVRFNYLIRGAGPLAVIQSVGWGLSASYLWNGLGPRLEANRTVLYFEPRGNGDSSKADPSTMNVRTMVEDLEHLRTRLGLETFPLLIGHSHGGAIALRYAQRYPDNVSKLLLIAPQVMDCAPGHVRAWTEKRKDDEAYAPSAKKLIEIAKGGGPRDDEHFRESLDTMLVWWFADVKNADVLRRDMAGPVASKNPATASAWQTNRNDMSEENTLPHIKDAGLVKAETLILQGEEDSVCSGDGAQAVADGIKDSEIKVLAGAGHFPWIEAPEEFWKEADAFLKL
ncbi:Proline iminopeptidase [Colletotrichum sp. SAR 10_86]|nr:Proline iminopeptidase [Colletotrichum sp. SAR 10_76]KAI8215994.1 Proline iminopeptidase [Colletotrichum sp. SAR 10_77]KAI8216807.1 Proline iminopeptidase [Colletotrichum sp. SAR 10_86]KAJ4994849.1 Proline iminopeptidase [Colletotrichum sp. SAR 10_66]